MELTITYEESKENPSGIITKYGTFMRIFSWELFDSEAKEKEYDENHYDYFIKFHPTKGSDLRKYFNGKWESGNSLTLDELHDCAVGFRHLKLALEEVNKC